MEKTLSLNYTSCGTPKRVSHGRQKVRLLTAVAGHSGATRTFFLKPIILVITPYYIDPLFKNKIFLTQKYVVEGLSARQIAREIFSSKMAVLNGLARFGITVREPHFHHGHPSQPRYGQKFRNHKLIEHKTEQRIINVVKELHEKGFSLRQIAKVLSEMKIVTKGKGKRWHQEMVRRILQSISSTDN